jgi:predicted dehydrogenase
MFEDNMQGARKVLSDMGKSGNKGNSWAAGTQSADISGKKLDVPDDHCFVGWDAYKKLLAIPEINYVICATPPGFRPIHLRAAIEAGKHVFVEKPVAVDPKGVRSIIESGEMAQKKGLAIVAGTQRRHQANYLEAIKRIQDGAIGQITAARASWLTGANKVVARQQGWSDMEYQMRNWLYFTWLSGDQIAEQHLHNIDVINWVMGAPPIKAYGMGGRQSRVGSDYGHVYDHFAVEYEYANGVMMTSTSRQVDNSYTTIGESVVGTKGKSNCCSLITVTGGTPWRWKDKFRNPYEQEHADAIQSIFDGKPLNEAKQVAESTLTAIMGREAAYSGQAVDWDSAMESELDLSPKKYEFGELPVAPVAIPGKYRFLS